MDLIALVLTVAIIGLLVWAIVTYIPMPPLFRQAIIAVAVIVIILYLLRTLGLMPGNVLPARR